MDGNISSTQSIGITVSIVTFMVVSGNLDNMWNKGNIFQNFCTNDRMLFDQVVFILCKLGRFIQDLIRNSDFSDIMEIGCMLQLLNLFRGPSQLCGNQCSIFCNPEGVSTGIFILRLKGSGQCLHHLQGKLLIFLLFFQLTLRFQKLYILYGPNKIDKQQDDHADANKQTG